MIIPKKHKIWVVMKDEEDNLFYITADERDRSVYYLFKKISGNDFEQLGTSSNPLKLEEKVFKKIEEE